MQYQLGLGACCNSGSAVCEGGQYRGVLITRQHSTRNICLLLCCAVHRTCPLRIVAGCRFYLFLLSLRLQQQQQQQELLLPSDKVMWGNATGLASAWPHLQQLKLSGLPAYAVGRTTWEGLSQLTALTALALQFTPMSSTFDTVCMTCSGLKQPVRSPGGGLPVVRLEHLPPTLQELQLTSCYLGVPASGSWKAG